MTAHVWPLYERIPVEDFEKTPEPGAIRKFCSEAVNQTVKRIHCERYHDGQLVTYIQADYNVAGRALLLVEAKGGRYAPGLGWHGHRARCRGPTWTRAGGRWPSVTCGATPVS